MVLNPNKMIYTYTIMVFAYNNLAIGLYTFRKPYIEYPYGYV